jgi:hypothetical protein
MPVEGLDIISGQHSGRFSGFSRDYVGYHRAFLDARISVQGLGVDAEPGTIGHFLSAEFLLEDRQVHPGESRALERGEQCPILVFECPGSGAGSPAGYIPQPVAGCRVIGCDGF